MSTPTKTGQGLINKIAGKAGPTIWAYDLTHPSVLHTLTFLNPRIFPKLICTGEWYPNERYYIFGAGEYADVCAKLDARLTVQLSGQVIAEPLMKPTGWM